MINEELTFQKFGYYAKDLSLHSNKKVITNCDRCGLVLEKTKHQSTLYPICKSCSLKGKNTFKKSEETKKKMSLARIGMKFTKEHKRNISEAKKGVLRTEEQKQRMRDSSAWKGKTGPEHPAYIDGRTALRIAIHNLQEYKDWRTSCFIRDKVLCQECLLRRGQEVHHIKAFKNIFQEFLSIYSQFSPIEDKETLVKLAIGYAPFWDLTNGKTVCLECHDKKHREEKEKCPRE